jgi:hypothetical protein
MKTTLRPGETIDIPSPGEIRAEIEAGVAAMAKISAAERERARAVKWLRFPRLRGNPASSAISLGGTGQSVGPEQGYLWSVRRLVITGLTASPSAPDIVNFYYTDNTGVTGPVWWQLNGNSFGTEFDMGGMMMRGGETLNVASVGTIAATGPIIVDWDGWEAPEDMAWKLIAGG